MNSVVIREINNINNIIKDNIIAKDYMERGLLSQNILSQLRNLVEDVIVLEYNKKYSENLGNSFEDKKKAYKDLAQRCKPKFLNDFHRYLQSAKSHYTCDYNGAECLMQKYYYYLLKLKKFLEVEFDISILQNIGDYPLNNDKSLSDYYEKIAYRIDQVKYKGKIKNARYYVEKSKPFYVNNNIYYEITLSSATDKINKFDRMIVYTKYDVLTNYAIAISYVEKDIDLFSSKTSIKIIDDWKVAIRSCEINNMSRIFNMDHIVKSNMIEYNNLMKYLTNNQLNLLDLCIMPERIYKEEKTKIGVAKTNYIFNLINECRNIINNSNVGYRVIRYLLYTMKNINIKKQLNKWIPLSYMSNLCLKSRCFPFEKLPFVMSLANHTPSGEDLFLSLDSTDCLDELLARQILKNIERNGKLYTSLEELNEYDNIDELIKKFNQKLYGEQKKLTIVKESDYVYMKGYEDDTIEIINDLNELSNEGIEGYKSSYEFWENFDGYKQDISQEKRNILKKLYFDTRVGLIYGSAGTGKTTLISCLADYFSKYDKVFLANTNTAVDNLRRRIKIINSKFYTISEYNSKEKESKKEDVLVIDECSTVSNRDILMILKESNYKVLLLVGDIHQIESINFGNWFAYAKQFVNNNSIHELTETFRSSNQDLLELWKKVRNEDDNIIEYIANKHFSSTLNETIFNKLNDEIILCLSYDGLYGINQINKYLQDANTNKKYEFGIKTFKIGDPVLFFDTKRFGNVLYNNLKGVINKIEETNEKMFFEVEIEKPLTEMDVMNSFVELVETRPLNSIIRFEIDKEFENDDDDEDKNNIVPFNVAYALSVHKAQGLEYNSVKVVLTKDIEKMISANIFYTAITRAKNKLKIYWTAETQKYIVEQIKDTSNKKDFYIFKNRNNL